MASSDLLSLALRLREQTGLSTEDDVRARLAKKISRLDAGEATEERKRLQRLLGMTAKVPLTNRDRP